MSKIDNAGNEALNLGALKNTEFYKKLSENSFIAGSIIPILAKAGTVFQWVFLVIFALVAIAAFGVLYETIKEGISEQAKKELNRQLANILNKYKPQIGQSYKEYLDLTKNIPNKINSLKNKYTFIRNIEEVEDINPIDFAKGWSKGLVSTIRNSKLKKQTSNIDYTFKVVLCSVGISDNIESEEQELAMYKEIESLLSTDNIKVECDYNGDDIFYVTANININIKQEDINKIISLINQAKIRDNKVAQESLYQEALNYHNELMSYNFNIANESLVTTMSRFIRNMLNVILKIMNNFKAMTIYGFRQLKRTELEAYTDSIALTTNRILNFSYASLYNLEVDIPLGMIKPYKVTTDKIRKCLESMNMVNRISSVTSSVNNLITSLMTGTSTVVKQSTINIGELKSLEQLYKEEHNCFSSTSRKDKELFSKVFESDHCFKDTYDLLKKVVANEYDVSKVFAMLEGLYSKFDSILKMLENKQTTLTKSDLIQLSSQTTTLAKLFDMYGILIEDLQKVEHNFVLIMKTIHKTYEL